MIPGDATGAASEKAKAPALPRDAPAGNYTATVEIAPGVFMPKLNLGTCCGSGPAVGMPAWFHAGGAGIDTAFDYLDEPARKGAP